MIILQVLQNKQNPFFFQVKATTSIELKKKNLYIYNIMAISFNNALNGGWPQLNLFKPWKLKGPSENGSSNENIYLWLFGHPGYWTIKSCVNR